MRKKKTTLFELKPDFVFIIDMEPDRCSFCNGKHGEGKTEFVAKVGEHMIAIKDVSALSVKTVGKH